MSELYSMRFLIPNIFLFCYCIISWVIEKKYIYFSFECILIMLISSTFLKQLTIFPPWSLRSCLHWSYIKQHSNCMFKEHSRISNQEQQSKSAVTEHSWSASHAFQFSSARKLKIILAVHSGVLRLFFSFLLVLIFHRFPLLLGVFYSCK